jgi:hypothetical protein
MNEVSRGCWEKLKEIKRVENRIKETELVRCIKYLLNNKNLENDSSISP